MGTVCFPRPCSGPESRRLKSKLSPALRTAPPRPSPRRGEGYEGPASATRAVGRSRVRGNTVAPRPPHPLGFASGPLPAGERLKRRRATPFNLHLEGRSETGRAPVSGWGYRARWLDRFTPTPTPPHKGEGKRTTFSTPSHENPPVSRKIHPRPKHLPHTPGRSPQTGTRIASRWNGAGAGAGSVALARHWAMSPQVPARPAVRLPKRSPTPVPEGKPTGRAAARSHTLLRQAIFGRPSSPPPPFSPCGRRWPEGPDEGASTARRETGRGGKRPCPI